MLACYCLKMNLYEFFYVVSNQRFEQKQKSTDHIRMAFLLLFEIYGENFYGIKPLWHRLCTCKYHFWENAKKHWSHLNGFSPIIYISSLSHQGWMNWTRMNMNSTVYSRWSMGNWTRLLTLFLRSYFYSPIFHYSVTKFSIDQTIVVNYRSELIIFRK